MCDHDTSIIGNVYLPDGSGDFEHVKTILKASRKYKSSEFIVTAGMFHGEYRAHIRLWSIDKVYPVRVKNIYVDKIGVNNKIMKKYQNILDKEKIMISREKSARSRTKYVTEYNRKLIMRYNLKKAPLTVFSFIKDEGKFFLERMLKSVVPYVNEVVIVDTGSTDNTKKLIRKYKKYGNLKYFKFPCKPDEIFKSINRALKAVTNEWILILAGDEAMLEEDLVKIPELLDNIQDTEVRIVKVRYLDFVRDFKHYHTLYNPKGHCPASRIWRNIKGFGFGGDYQGDIYMGYNDGVQTGGISTKKNLPKKYVYDRPDIFFHHYARCKDKKTNLAKRVKYYKKRMPGSSDTEVLRAAKKCKFYTLDFGDKIAEYNGKQAGVDEKPIIGFYTYSRDFSHFARPIINQLKSMGYIVVEEYDNPRKLYNKVDWLWVEWGDHWAREVLNGKRNCKVIVRIHRYEITRDICKTIKWKNADMIWFINSEVMENFKKKFPDLKTPMIYLPNAVPTETLEFNPDKKYGKEIAMYSVNFLGVKDYPTAINLFKELNDIDNEYKLTIRSGISVGNKSFKRCEKLAEGYPVTFKTNDVNKSNLDKNNDINRLLRNKDILLSTSKYESFHYSIAEALCCGLQVFVRGWNRGGNPDEFWPQFVYDSKEEMIDAIMEWSKMSDTEKQKIAKENKKYVEDNFGSEVITRKFVDKLDGNIVPHVVVVIPTYNGAKLLKQTLNSLINQTYKNTTIVVVNDGSTDRTLKVLKKYRNNIIYKTIKHGGAHRAMDIGIGIAKEINADYTILFGGDDIANTTYIEDMLVKAECDDAWLVYPDFNLIDVNNVVIGKFIANEPDLEKLKRNTYICDHSLVSREFWNRYGWKIRWEEFDAYSVFHLWLTLMKDYPDKVSWLNKRVWNYRQRDDSLHMTTKKSRKGQRKKVLKDILGD
jgi:glycosyltransferase involved in cell wall biosynthesis